MNRYGRLLAYVRRTSDGLFVNEALVRARVGQRRRPYPPNVRYADEFRREGAAALARRAPASGGVCGGHRHAGRSDVGTRAHLAQPGACDPNYSGACVPVGAGQLRCRDISVKRFRVVGKDVQGFDGDGDGIACE